MRLDDFVFFPGLVLETIGILVMAAGFLTDDILFFYLGAGLLCIAIAVHVVRIVRRCRSTPSACTDYAATLHHENRGGPGILYSDGLVTISADSITFHNYSFPFFSGDRTVPFSDIDYIDVKKPSVLTGKWRIAGSGNLSTWFPMDSKRPSRDRIFHARVRGRGMNVGFTVEHPAEVTAILKKKGLIRADELLA